MLVCNKIECFSFICVYTIDITINYEYVSHDSEHMDIEISRLARGSDVVEVGVWVLRYVTVRNRTLRDR